MLFIYLIMHTAVQSQTAVTVHLIFNPLTAGVTYIRVFIFYSHINYHLLNMLNIKCDINQQYLKADHPHFVKSDYFHSLEVVDRVSETQLQVGENSN